ncbi:beta-ketoacyl-ACP synthase [Francisella philomiragia]|uniref:beta-ketoacyl-ACP synthase n=1 Tax=Francisella philomiragia TaxID=28110 RepID=UPI001B8AF92B|nr:beta-ketoacyl-ACP synthase [Francisella philomiragia]QUE31107.1 beta-ketoacyl-ACP synthase [Francisella philomiragia]
MSGNEIYLNSLGIINCLGDSKQAVLQSLLSNQTGLVTDKNLLSGRKTIVGQINDKILPEIPPRLKEFDCRNNQMALHACMQINHDISRVIDKYGADRVAVVCGTSTSGIDNGERALTKKFISGQFPKEFSYKQEETAGLSEFLREYYNLENIAFTISTACSSSGKAFASAARLLKQNLCDAVIVVGCDTLCELTLNGFDCLDAISQNLCLPFHNQRDGINIGEGAAAFIMSRDCSEIVLLGVGESSDGYHITAPDPSGEGAKLAMIQALSSANLAPDDIGYLNLHGTATILNDNMESNAVRDIFKAPVACSSTKSLTGHTLGAAAATEVGICWLLLSDNYNPNKKLPKQYDSDKDIISDIGIITSDIRYRKPNFMSNSFAFGGNNVSVIIGKK